MSDRDEVRSRALSSLRRGSDIRAPQGARCTRCAKIVRADGHGGFCSSDCAEAARESLSDAELRRQVLERDQGVCAICGLGCLELRADVDELRLSTRAAVQESFESPEANRSMNRWRARLHLLKRAGFTRSDIDGGGALWQADHVTPRVQGGPSTIENARTLCLPCHRSVTGDLASSRASSRRPRRRP